MRGNAAPKVYRSFEEFERDELRKLDGIHISIDDMLDDMFAADFANASATTTESIVEPANEE
jgi:hypothetical protein